MEDVGAEQRRSAKAINFGLIYGMSAFGLAQQLGIERGAAKDYVDRYFARYPGVKAYMENTRRSAAERVTWRPYSVAGCICRTSAPATRSFGKRRNGPPSTPDAGTAADIIKRAMLAVDRWLRESGFPARMLMQVHDELVFEVAEDAVTEAGERIRTAMVTAAGCAYRWRWISAWARIGMRRIERSGAKSGEQACRDQLQYQERYLPQVDG